MHSVFLLAAGFGTRLRPLTNHRPKPLLPLLGQPMLNYAVAHLRNHGHSSFLVNAHHLWEKVAAWATEQDIEIQVELPDILGTGGGLKAAQSKMASKFIIWNGDIFSDINPTELLSICPENGASMALYHNEDIGSTTRLLLDDTGQIARIGNLCAKEGAEALPTSKDGVHFSGIHVIANKALDIVPEGFQCIIRSGYIHWVPKGRVNGMVHQGHWVDTGTPEEYWRANMQALRGRFPLPLEAWKDTQEHPNSWIHQDATVQGMVKESIIGANAVVHSETRLQNCIVWDDIEVSKGDYKNCIFHDGGVLQLDHELTI